MITILRKHHRWLMIVIAILAIPFCFYFTKTDLGAARNDDLGKIYGRTVTHVEFQRNARLFNLARDLGMITLLQDLTAGATSEVSAYSEFTWNRLILRREAEQLGIKPGNAEVVALVRTLTPFTGQSGFDINKYNQFVSTELPALGFTEAQIEELAADQLALNRVKELVAAGVQIPESESRENFEQAYGKMNVAVVRLRSEDFAKDVKISDEDIAKYYESHKAQLNTDEKRKVEFVGFALNDEQKKLTGKERIEALQKLADRANDFTQALLDKNANFGALAQKFQVPLKATGDFTAAAPDPQLADPQLAQHAFRLTQAEPFSDAIQSADGFYVLHLLGKTDARPLTLEEAKPKIVEALKTERSRELMAKRGAEIATAIRDGLKSGTPLDAVAQKIAVKLDRLPPFALIDTAPGAKPEPPKDPKTEAPDLPMIKNATAELKPGETTDFVPTETGGLVAVLEKREPIDPAAYQQGKAAFDSRYLRNKRSIVFYEWLRDRRSAAGIEAKATAT